MDQLLRLFNKIAATPFTGDLGTGFSSVASELRDSAFLPDVPSTRTKDLTNNYSLKLLTSEKQLRNELGVSAQASASLFGVRVNASMDYLREERRAATSLFFFAEVKAQKSKSRIARPTMTSQALELLADRAYETFINRFGDYHIAEQYFGGKLNIVLELSTSSLHCKEELATELSAKGSAWSGETAVASKMDQILEQYELNIRGFESGVGEIDAFQDRGKFVQYVMGFPGRVEEDNVFETTLESYLNVTSEVGPLYRELEPAIINFEHLVGFMASYRDNKTRLEHMRDNPDLYSLTPSEIAEVERMLEATHIAEDAIKAHWNLNNRHYFDLKDPRTLEGIEGHLDVADPASQKAFIEKHRIPAPIVSIQSEPKPKGGQKSRSSDNFTIAAPAGTKRLYWEVDYGTTKSASTVNFRVALDLKGRDRTWKTGIHDRQVTDLPKEQGRGLYVCLPANASDKFMVHVYPLS